MRILFINKYQNKVFRGAETYVYELSRRLSKNHQVDVISDINYRTLLKKKYDVIIPTNGRWQVIFIRKIAWLTGAKMIVSGQSGMGWDDRINLYTFPNAFVALSTKALNWAKKVNPFVQSVYIPNGVDLGKFTINNLQFTNKDKKRKTVLAVGAATKQKRLDLVVKAVAKLDKVKLIIASGGGEFKNEIYDLGIKELGKDRFEMISVPFEKMPEVYQSADVFTLPSASSESFGNVLVEAMASGLPVVATDDPVRHEIVGEAGIFVDPTNTDEYARALEKALSIDWGNASRRQAEKFNWDRIAQKYEELFKTLVKKD
jgi:glycosyltransferase involved in cell wall biosynthesis